MQVLEQRVPVRALQLVDRFDGGLGVARAVARPGGEQRRCEIGDRPAHRLRQILLGAAVLLLLERAHPDDQPGDPVVAVERDHLLGEPRRPPRRRLPPAPRGRRVAAVRCSSDRCAAPRDNRRRRRRRRAACRHDAPRDSCPTSTAGPVRPPPARRSGICGGFCEVPCADSVAGRHQRRRAKQQRLPDGEFSSKRSRVNASMGGGAPALRVGRRMDFLQPPARTAEPRAAMPVCRTLQTAVWQYRDRTARTCLTCWNISARRRLRAAPR